MHRPQKVLRELAELTVDDIWQIADAGDQELRENEVNYRRLAFETDGVDYIN